MGILLRNESYSRQLRPTGLLTPEGWETAAVEAKIKAMLINELFQLGPVVIQVALELLSISTINEVNMVSEMSSSLLSQRAIV